MDLSSLVILEHPPDPSDLDHLDDHLYLVIPEIYHKDTRTLIQTAETHADTHTHTHTPAFEKGFIYQG